MSLKLLKLSNVLECRIVRRLNRFIVEVELNGVKSRAYVNNTGRLTVSYTHLTLPTTERV